MDTYLVYEIIGYVASVLIAVSLMMSRIVQLRFVNMIGAAAFALYGYLIGSVPVAAMNGFIVLINVYYLTQMALSKEYLRMLEVNPESKYLSYFLDFYRIDINTYQPGFDIEAGRGNFNVFVLRDTVPAGLVSGELENGILKLDLDFVAPSYRDFKIARFLYIDNRDFFINKKVAVIEAPAVDDKYGRYLQKIGFSPVRDASGLYRLKL